MPSRLELVTSAAPGSSTSAKGKLPRDQQYKKDITIIKRGMEQLKQDVRANNANIALILHLLRSHLGIPWEEPAVVDTSDQLQFSSQPEEPFEPEPEQRTIAQKRKRSSSESHAEPFPKRPAAMGDIEITELTDDDVVEHHEDLPRGTRESPATDEDETTDGQEESTGTQGNTTSSMECSPYICAVEARVRRAVEIFRVAGQSRLARTRAMGIFVNYMQNPAKLGQLRHMMRNGLARLILDWLKVELEAIASWTVEDLSQMQAMLGYALPLLPVSRLPVDTCD